MKRFCISCIILLFIITSFSWALPVCTEWKPVNFTNDTYPDALFADVKYIDGKFIAVGENGTVAISTDGINWTWYEGNVGGTFRMIAYGDGAYVAVVQGGGGAIYYSEDGIHWNEVANSTDTGGKDLYGVFYANNSFYALGNNCTMLTSSDGENWTLNTDVKDFCNSTTQYDLYVGLYAQGKYIISGSVRGGGGVTIYSNDGSNWYSVVDNNLPGFDDMIYEGIFIAGGGSEGRLYVSSNGTDWSEIYDFPTDATVRGIVHALGQYVIVQGDPGSNGYIWVSDDLDEGWIQQYSSGNDLWQVAYHNGIFVAVGDNGTILYTQCYIPSVPTLDEWGRIVFVFLILLSGVYVIYKRKIHS